MILAFQCQDCGAVEYHDVEGGDFAETIEIWHEERADWVCDRCERAEASERIECGYYLD